MYDLPSWKQEPPLPQLLGKEDLLDPGPRAWFLRLFYVPSLANPRGLWEVIKWWELRRIPYNLIIGGIGAVGYFLMLSHWVRHGKHHGHFPSTSHDFVTFPIDFTVVMNMAYTAGWIIEAFLFLVGIHHRRIGPVLLMIGSAFSLVIVGVSALVEMLRGL